MKRIYVLLVSLCSLIGCAVIPTSTEKKPTLLVGTCVYTGSGHVSRNGLSLDGTTTSGIEVTMINIATHEVFRFSPGKNGLFHVNLPEGKYMIGRFYIKKERSTGAMVATSYPAKIVLEIEKNKVNNVGTINWHDPNWKSSVIQTDNAQEIKDEFVKQYPKSNWNQKEWIYTPLSFDVNQHVNNISLLEKTINLSTMDSRALKWLQEWNEFKDEIHQVGDRYYVMRNMPNKFTRLLQDSTNLWLKDATNWLQKKTSELHTESFSANPGIEEIKAVVFNQVFQDNKARLESLLKTEPQLLYKCLIDKSGNILEVMFDLAPDSQLRFDELHQIEMALKQSVRFSDIHFRHNTLESIPAKYLLYTGHIEFSKK